MESDVGMAVPSELLQQWGDTHTGRAVGRDAAGDACCRHVARQCCDPACPVLCRRCQCLAFHGVELTWFPAVTLLMGWSVGPRRSGVPWWLLWLIDYGWERLFRLQHCSSTRSLLPPPRAG